MLKPVRRALARFNGRPEWQLEQDIQNLESAVADAKARNVTGTQLVNSATDA